MQTSLPPNRQAKERHQETQLRRELQKRIRSRGKRRACTVRAANAAEQRIRSAKFACASLPAEKAERRLRPSAGRGVSHAQLAGRSETARKPSICSNRESGSTGRKAWSRSTACFAGPESWRTDSPQIADPTGQRSPLR